MHHIDNPQHAGFEVLRVGCGKLTGAAVVMSGFGLPSEEKNKQERIGARLKMTMLQIQAFRRVGGNGQNPERKLPRGNKTPHAVCKKPPKKLSTSMFVVPEELRQLCLTASLFSFNGSWSLFQGLCPRWSLDRVIGASTMSRELLKVAPIILRPSEFWDTTTKPWCLGNGSAEMNKFRGKNAFFFSERNIVSVHDMKKPLWANGSEASKSEGPPLRRGTTSSTSQGVFLLGSHGKEWATKCSQKNNTPGSFL